MRSSQSSVIYQIICYFMIDPSSALFYVYYGIVCAVLGVLFIRIRSTEGLVITTKEFQIFQSSFIGGYACVILCELVASATFYRTFVLLDLELSQIARLYLATLFASTLTSAAMEIVDIGAKKDRCVLTALLYSASMFSIFFGGHYEMVLLGRLLYGAAQALQHSSFEAYALQQHASNGFPEDWLSHTFSLLTHVMALVAVVSGPVGALAVSGGVFGPVAFCSAVFALLSGYIFVVWEKDISSPRFLMSSFLSSLGQSIQAVRANRQLGALLALSSCYEASISIFLFYWAPWIASVTMSEQQVSKVPYEVIFATLVSAAMAGSYLCQLCSGSLSTDSLLSWLLIGTSVCYGLAAMLQSVVVVLPLALVLQVCMGAYWPSIGVYRGRLLLSELRSATLLLPKIAVLAITVVVVGCLHHSPLLLLMSCAALTGCAAYIQIVYVSLPSQPIAQRCDN
eukprot:scaffold1046_cov162-Ochromonas_danica.AAC.43